MKKEFEVACGANDFETLNFQADEALKSIKMLKWGSILLGLVSFPLIVVVIGVPMFFGALGLYFFGYRRGLKKLLAFKEHLQNDPDFSQT